jgi:UDP-N-acetylenolpyruvoylglucosamine reductase
MALRGKLYQHKKLSEYTSWKVGGQAELLFVPADLEDLIFFFNITRATAQSFF